MNLLIKFPSRSRPEQFKKALDSYIRYSSNLDKIQFIFTLDSNDERLDEYFKIIQSRPINQLIVVGESRGKISAINRDLSLLKDLKYDVILLASDDMIAVQRYQDAIEQKFNELGDDRVFWFSDGNQKRLNTLVIIGRKYFEHFLYLYHPSYVSLWCDNEFHDVAIMLGKMNTEPYECIIEHQHFAHNRQYKSDDLYRENDKYWDVDKNNYYTRKQNNFQ